MSEFKMGKKAISGHGFPSEFGFSGSTGKVRTIGPYTRRTPGSGPMSDQDSKMTARSRAKAAMEPMPSVLRGMKSDMDRVSGRLMKAEGGKVDGNAATLRNQPANELDAETGGKTPLRPGFAKGGKMSKSKGKPMKGALSAATSAVKGGMGKSAAMPKATAKGAPGFNRKPLFGR